jgi:hypothetical protein
MRIRRFRLRMLLRDVTLKTLVDELFDVRLIFGLVLVAAISGAVESAKEPELFITPETGHRGIRRVEKLSRLEKSAF